MKESFTNWLENYNNPLVLFNMPFVYAALLWAKSTLFTFELDSAVNELEEIYNKFKSEFDNPKQTL